MACEPNWDHHESSKWAICQEWPMGSKKSAPAIEIQISKEKISERLGPNSVIDEEDMNNSQQQPQTSTSRIVPPTSPTAPRFFDWFDQAGCWYLALLEPCSALGVTGDRREGSRSKQLQDVVFFLLVHCLFYRDSCWLLLLLLLLLLLTLLFSTSWHMYI